MRPPTERYCRCVVTEGNLELILGTEMRDPGEYFILLSTSQMLLRDVVESLSGSHAVTNPALLAEVVGAEVVKQWPDRLFFLEVCSAGDRDGWCQVYSGQVARLEERIAALEARPTEDDWAKVFERINKHDNSSRGASVPVRTSFVCLFCGRNYPSDGYCSHGAK